MNILLLLQVNLLNRRTWIFKFWRTREAPYRDFYCIYAMKTLILASTSPARKALLERLQIPFQVIPPNVEEIQLPGESGFEMAKRLAQVKAQAVADKVKAGLIIGCDQVICLDNEIFGKPGIHDQAVAQLTKMSGKQVTSWTGLCLINAATGNKQITVERYDVYLRNFTPEIIEKYLQKEQPYQCAGSIRAEGLGVVLFEKLAGDDYSALIGLPLIKLIKFLEHEGMRII